MNARAWSGRRLLPGSTVQTRVSRPRDLPCVLHDCQLVLTHSLGGEPTDRLALAIEQLDHPGQRQHVALERTQLLAVDAGLPQKPLDLPGSERRVPVRQRLDHLRRIADSLGIPGCQLLRIGLRFLPCRSPEPDGPHVLGGMDCHRIDPYRHAVFSKVRVLMFPPDRAPAVTLGDEGLAPCPAPDLWLQIPRLLREAGPGDVPGGDQDVGVHVGRRRVQVGRNTLQFRMRLVDGDDRSQALVGELGLHECPQQLYVITGADLPVGREGEDELPSGLAVLAPLGNLHGRRQACHGGETLGRSRWQQNRAELRRLPMRETVRCPGALVLHCLAGDVGCLPAGIAVRGPGDIAHPGELNCHGDHPPDGRLQTKFAYCVSRNADAPESLGCSHDFRLLVPTFTVKSRSTVRCPAFHQQWVP